MLKLYNTLTGQKETFAPLVPGRAGMYACGVTVYDECHLGHARSALIFDVLRRYLRYSGYQVTYVRNFTDVDDKIIARASQEGVSSQEIVRRYLAAYDRDMTRLGLQPADIEPKATEHIPDIVAMIGTLIEKGHAYRVDGDVFFAVGSFPAYGRLSKRNVEDMLAGARVEVDDRKRDPMDFALWKASKPGEPAWESPWGKGRPGWHIECSAMSVRHLGPVFDIHGGGMDLIFPHHENEIAQSCAATGKEFARYWLHNGFVRINQEKMSKSLGNFFTIREIFEKWRYSEHVTGEVLRYFLLATHYRSPLEFSDHGLQEAKRALDGFYDLFGRLAEPSADRGEADGRVAEACARCERGFREAMDDDLNTPGALAQWQTLRGEINRQWPSGLSAAAGRSARDLFRSTGAVAGLFQLAPGQWEFNPRGGDAPRAADEAAAAARLGDEEVEDLLSERAAARRARNFPLADEIRKRLAEHGITIEDRPDGTTRWKR